jgi:hypothetical protein
MCFSCPETTCLTSLSGRDRPIVQEHDRTVTPRRNRGRDVTATVTETSRS